MSGEHDSGTFEDRSPRSVLEGTLERITYHNEENGYTVAKLMPRGRDYTVTVVGRMAGLNIGASVKLWGRWKRHAQYGKQFVVEDYAEQLPATVEGIRKYLGSGLIKGVGPVTADRIVDHFGLESLAIIDEQPGRLTEVPGVGRVRARKITEAWAEQQEIKEIMLFLQAHDVSTSLAVRIYKTYRGEAIAVVRDEPYRLAREVFGIGFKTADRIARSAGMAPDSPQRLEAGVLYTLNVMADEGHVFGRREELIAAAARELAVPASQTEGDGGALTVDEQAISQAIDRLLAADAVRIEVADGDGAVAAEDRVRGGGSDSAGGSHSRVGSRPHEGSQSGEARSELASSAHDAVYLPPMYYAEIGVANRLSRLMRSEASCLGAFRSIDWDTALAWVERRQPHALAARQRQAVRMALTEKVSVLTGGPGTGKTTTVRAILDLVRAKGLTARLAAPTGRAAKRLAETCGMEAKTIHRLLEFKPSGGVRFLRNEENPLRADLLVVDETSMVDLLLMNDLTKAIDPATHLLLVGDVDQLPSVGPGNVLRDLIDSGVVPTVELNEIFRQDEHSYIIVNAHRVNQGEMPIFDRRSRDFFLFPAEDAEAAADWVVDVVAERIPAKFGLDPLRDVQVLSPMHRGPAGVTALNGRLQQRLNPAVPNRPVVRFGGREFRIDDKVMQIRNNYDKDVFNGDLGWIEDIDGAAQLLTVMFDDVPVEYEFSELDELIHAFACSTHKSQGAEYPAVVMTLLTSHYMMLQRNLLYTGITRAKRLCVLVGSRRAIAMAVRNDKVAARNTSLARRLREAM